jgi:hypothetical protein
LAEFLVSSSYPDGETRTPGTLILFIQEGHLKVLLSDRDQGLVAFVTACGLLDGLERADRGLREDSLDWRKARAAPPKKK